MTKLFTVIILVVTAFIIPPAAQAMPLNEVVQTIDRAGGYHQWGAASLNAADCSGLVSIAQTLAMGQRPHRLGNTHSLLAGQWPHAIPGATRNNLFVIGTSRTHMAASVNGVNIESRGRGERWRIGADAASPWSPQFTHRFHIDRTVLGVA